MRPSITVLLLFLFSFSGWSQPFSAATFGGGGLPVNRPATAATLRGPAALAVDPAGNLFIVEPDAAVFRVDAQTGVISLVAGNRTPGFSGDDGRAVNAQLNYTNGIAVDSAGNLYIADGGNLRVRRVTNGIITTIAGSNICCFGGDGGPATAAVLDTPWGLTTDRAGNLYIADWSDSVIRKISGGIITTVAGRGGRGYGGDGGPATSGLLYRPQALAVDSSGNLYIADTYNHCVREVSNGIIATVIGNGTPGNAGGSGPAASTQLNLPEGIAVDASGRLYISDTNNGRILQVSSGTVTTLATLNAPTGLALDASGTLYVASQDTTQVYKFVGGRLIPVAGGGSALSDAGPAASAMLDGPRTVAIGPGGDIYVVDQGNNRIGKISHGVFTTVAGGAPCCDLGDNGPAASAYLSSPAGIAFDSAGNMYISDTGNNVVRKVSGGIVTTVAGNGIPGYGGDGGPATSAMLYSPVGIALDSAGSLYIADLFNNRIRMVSRGLIATVAGNGTAGFSGDNGPPLSAELHYPQAVAVDSAGDLYIADTGNNAIREVSNSVIRTVLGSGAQPTNFTAVPEPLAPTSILLDSANNLYIAAQFVYKFSNGALAIVAGNGQIGFSGDGGPATLASMTPFGLAMDARGNFYVADPSNDRIRILTPGLSPAITVGGIVPNGGTANAIQPGSWISIYGSDLATSAGSLWNGDFPESLGGTTVIIDNRPAYLWFASPQQINAQAPDDAPTGPVSVVVTTSFGSATGTVTLAAVSPAFSLLGDGMHVAGEILTPEGNGAYDYGTYDLVGPANTFSYSTRPVKAGETLVLYGVGFGPTSPNVAAGAAFSGAASTQMPVKVTIGGAAVPVGFAGMIEAGLYQLNVTVPPGIGAGDQPIVASVNGVLTPPGSVVTIY